MATMPTRGRAAPARGGLDGAVSQFLREPLRPARRAFADDGGRAGGSVHPTTTANPFRRNTGPSAVKLTATRQPGRTSCGAGRSAQPQERIMMATNAVERRFTLRRILNAPRDL